MGIALATPSFVNLGSGNYPLDGWLNIDAYVDADVQGDVFELSFEALERVRMSHLLEHISWRRTEELLQRVLSWMRPGGNLEIEVPDMEAILARGCIHPLWFKYVYGDQSHPGEYHLAGFTLRSLRVALESAGWTVMSIERFESDHKGREGMPCLKALARA